MVESSQTYSLKVTKKNQVVNNKDTSNLKLKNSSSGADESEINLFRNGYHFPPRHTWLESIIIQSQEFRKYFCTPFGFLITIYSLNIVGWGGMLFLLICNAAPAMCEPSCQDINSSRRIWIEIDSQILNALFCLTGLGTIPWRFRDLWYLMQYRIFKKNIGLRRLAGIHKSWFRLQKSQDILAPSATGSEDLASVSPNSLTFPLSETPDPPLTGIRAPPTAIWKLDLFIWAMIWNTIFQAVLLGLMCGFDRSNRPSWSTGLFITLGCLVAFVGGLTSFLEARKIKAIEGVPLSEKDLAKLTRDEEAGIFHWNNIKNKRPREIRGKI